MLQLATFRKKITIFMITFIIYFHNSTNTNRNKCKLSIYTKFPIWYLPWGNFLENTLCTCGLG